MIHDNILEYGHISSQSEFPDQKPKLVWGWGGTIVVKRQVLRSFEEKGSVVLIPCTSQNLNFGLFVPVPPTPPSMGAPVSNRNSCCEGHCTENNVHRQTII